MEAKKTRGRKPIKDKKIPIRIYVYESDVNNMGGDLLVTEWVRSMFELKAKKYRKQKP